MKFQINHTYYDRSSCDYDTIFSFKILARTEKTVTVEMHGKTVKRGVYVYDGREQFRPYGTYSMCAVVSADRELVK